MDQESRNKEKLEAELDGEELLWSSSPARGPSLRQWVIILVVLTTTAGILIGIITLVLVKRGSEIISWMELAVPPVIFIYGLVLFLLDSRKLKSTIYGLTKNDVIIIEGDQVRKLDLLHIPDVILHELPDGTGDINLEGRSMPTYRWPEALQLKKPTLRSVSDPQIACEVIKKAWREAGGGV